MSKPSARRKSAPKSRPTTKPKLKRAPTRGESVIWPAGLDKMTGWSSVTRWRRERDGSIPPRDVKIGKATGWKPETIAKLFGTVSS